MSKVSLKIPDIHTCTKKDLTFAINILATELKRKLDAEKNEGIDWDDGL